MNVFEFLLVIVSIVLGLAVTDLLAGFVCESDPRNRVLALQLWFTYVFTFVVGAAQTAA